MNGDFSYIRMVCVSMALALPAYIILAAIVDRLPLGVYSRRHYTGVMRGQQYGVKGTDIVAQARANYGEARSWKHPASPLDAIRAGYDMDYIYREFPRHAQTAVLDDLYMLPLLGVSTRSLGSVIASATRAGIGEQELIEMYDFWLSHNSDDLFYSE